MSWDSIYLKTPLTLRPSTLGPKMAGGRSKFQAGNEPFWCRSRQNESIGGIESEFYNRIYV